MLVNIPFQHKKIEQKGGNNQENKGNNAFYFIFFRDFVLRWFFNFFLPSISSTLRHPAILFPIHFLQTYRIEDGQKGYTDIGKYGLPHCCHSKST